MTATMTMQPTADGESTTVNIMAELAVTGRPAQFGRGMITEVGGKLVGQFAANLAQRLAEAPPAAPAARAEAPAAAAGIPVQATGSTGAAQTDGTTGTAQTGGSADGAQSGGATTVDVLPAAETPVAVSAPAATAAPAAAPPVDLLQLGAGPVLRRVGPYLVGFVAGVLVTWAVTAWLG